MVRRSSRVFGVIASRVDYPFQSRDMSSVQVEMENQLQMGYVIRKS